VIKINININSFIEKTDKILFAVNTGKNIGYNSDFFGNSFYFIFTESTYKDKIKNSMKKFLNENIYENENKILFSSDNTDIFITIDCIENINNYAGEITKTGYFSEECIIKDTENFSRLIEKNTYDIKKYIDDFIINFRLFCLFLNNSKILTAHKYYIKAIENVNLINNYKDGEELYDLWFLGRLGKENLFYGLNSLYCGIDHFSLMNSREKLKNYFISSIDGLTDDKEKIEKDLIAVTEKYPEVYNFRDASEITLIYSDIKMKSGKIFRSASLSRYSDEIIEKILNKYGITFIIDLRGEMEKEHYRKIRKNNYSDYIKEKYVRDFPIEPIVNAVYVKEDEALNFYYYIIKDNTETIGNIFNEVFSYSDRGNFLIHCEGGKDRAGTVISLLLLLLGVPEKTVVQEYYKSYSYLKPDTMEKVIDLINTEFGGIDNYLINHCGVHVKNTEKIKKILKEQ